MQKKRNKRPFYNTILYLKIIYEFVSKLSNFKKIKIEKKHESKEGGRRITPFSERKYQNVTLHQV